MILYLDSSAIVKKYTYEPGSDEVESAVEEAEAIGTTTISRAEVVAALRKAIRMRVLVGFGGTMPYNSPRPRRGNRRSASLSR